MNGGIRNNHDIFVKNNIAAIYLNRPLQKCISHTIFLNNVVCALLFLMQNI